MNAIVQVLYENTACFLEALVCARSIRESGTHADLVLLCERSVPEWQRELLGKYYTRIVLIDPYPVSDGLFSADSLARYKGVFGKLYAFSMEEYEKVLLLDLDTLVLSNLDQLYETPTPAAYFDELELRWQHGVKMDSKLIEYRSKNPKAGKGGGYMNVGVCLIKPSFEVFNVIDRRLSEVVKGNFGGLIYAEQEFLRDFFLPEWYQLSYAYNFFVASLPGYVHRAGRNLLELQLSDLKIIHFLYFWKPVYLYYHPEALQEIGKYFPKNAIGGLIEYVRHGSSFPDFDSATDATTKFHAIMGAWCEGFRMVQKELNRNLESGLKVPFYLSESELKAKLEQLDAIKPPNNPLPVPSKGRPRPRIR